MRLRSLLVLGLVAGVAVTACGSDDDGGGSGGGTSTGGSGGSTGGSGGSTGGSGGSATGGSAGSSSGGSAGASTGGSAGSSTGGSAGASTGGSAGASTGGSAGAGTGGADGGAKMTAEAFCASYETHCGFGTTGHYSTNDDCKTKYNGYSETRQGCVVTHLGLATSKTSEHCAHAAGAAPCN